MKPGAVQTTLCSGGRAAQKGEIVGVITEVSGGDGGPPYVVRWYDDGRQSKVCPNQERFWVRASNVCPTWQGGRRLDP